MIIWNVLDEDEADRNKDNLEREYVLKGTLSHPINFRPYAMMQHKEDVNQVYLVPMQVADIDEQ